MNESKEPRSKVIVGESGVGVTDEAAAKERARQLALSDGRTAFNQKDLAQAREELAHSNSAPAAPEVPAGSEEQVAWDDAPDEAGHRVVTRPPDNEEDIGIQLVQEGLEEADHDSRVQSSGDLAEDAGGDGD